jgi:hypothetical protein
MRAAASDAGRDPMSVTPANWLFVMTGRSRDEVDESLHSNAAKAFALNIPDEIWPSCKFSNVVSTGCPIGHELEKRLDHSSRGG